MEQFSVTAKWEDWLSGEDKLNEDDFHDSGNGSSPEESLISRTTELQLQPISRSRIKLYHHVPEFDRVCTVKCRMCGKIIRIQSFAVHCAKRHGCHVLAEDDRPFMRPREQLKATSVGNVLAFSPLIYRDDSLDQSLERPLRSPQVDESLQMVSALSDREASNISSATEEQNYMNDLVHRNLDGHSGGSSLVVSSMDDSICHPFLINGVSEDINRNNCFKLGLTGAELSVEEQKTMPSQVSAVGSSPVGLSAVQNYTDGPSFFIPQFSSEMKQEIKSECAVQEHPVKLEENKFELFASSLDLPNIPIFKQDVDIEDSLPEDLRNIVIKKDFDCPEMNQLLQSDLNLTSNLDKSSLMDFIGPNETPIPVASLDSSQNVAAISPSTPKKSPPKVPKKRTRARSQVFDPDRHCGVTVVKNEIEVPCMRAISCKAHSLSSRRAVAGRSKPLLVLMKILNAEKNALKMEKERELAVLNGTVYEPPTVGPVIPVVNSFHQMEQKPQLSLEHRKPLSRAESSAVVQDMQEKEELVPLEESLAISLTNPLYEARKIPGTPLLAFHKSSRKLRSIFSTLLDLKPKLSLKNEKVSVKENQNETLLKSSPPGAEIMGAFPNFMSQHKLNNVLGPVLKNARIDKIPSTVLYARQQKQQVFETLSPRQKAEANMSNVDRARSASMGMANFPPNPSSTSPNMWNGNQNYMVPMNSTIHVNHSGQQQSFPMPCHQSSPMSSSAFNVNQSNHASQRILYVESGSPHQLETLNNGTRKRKAMAINEQNSSSVSPVAAKFAPPSNEQAFQNVAPQPSPQQSQMGLSLPLQSPVEASVQTPMVVMHDQWNPQQMQSPSSYPPTPSPKLPSSPVKSSNPYAAHQMAAVQQQFQTSTMPASPGMPPMYMNAAQVASKPVAQHRQMMPIKINNQLGGDAYVQQTSPNCHPKIVPNPNVAKQMTQQSQHCVAMNNMGNRNGASLSASESGMNYMGSIGASSQMHAIPPPASPQNNQMGTVSSAQAISYNVSSSPTGQSPVRFNNSMDSVQQTGSGGPQVPGFVPLHRLVRPTRFVSQNGVKYIVENPPSTQAHPSQNPMGMPRMANRFVYPAQIPYHQKGTIPHKLYAVRGAPLSMGSPHHPQMYRASMMPPHSHTATPLSVNTRAMTPVGVPFYRGQTWQSESQYQSVYRQQQPKQNMQQIQSMNSNMSYGSPTQHYYASSNDSMQSGSAQMNYHQHSVQSMNPDPNMFQYPSTGPVQSYGEMSIHPSSSDPILIE